MKTIKTICAAAAAILCTLPVLAQEKPNQNGFVTLELNWAEGSAPAENQPDGDAMRQILERDEARVKWLQERVKAKAPEIKPELLNEGQAPEEPKKAGEQTPATTTLRPSTVNTISADQMRQIHMAQDSFVFQKAQRTNSVCVFCLIFFFCHFGELLEDRTCWRDLFSAIV